MLDGILELPVSDPRWRLQAELKQRPGFRARYEVVSSRNFFG